MKIMRSNKDIRNGIKEKYENVNEIRFRDKLIFFNNLK